MEIRACGKPLVRNAFRSAGRRRLWVAVLVALVGAHVVPAVGQDSARRIGRVASHVPAWETEGFDPSESTGLFVGIRRFEDPEFVEVPYAVDDAVDLAHLFSLELALIDPRRVVLCLRGEPAKSASRTRLRSLKRAGVETCKPDLMEIYKQVERLAEASGERGLFVLTMASHGFSAGGADLVLAADSRYRLLTSTGLSLASVLDLMTQSRTRRGLVLLDACRERLSSERAGGADPASALGRTFVDAIARAEGQAVLMGTVLGGYSYNDHSRQAGVFTGAVIDGLRGAAPSGTDQLITVRELADFVDRRVVDWIRRHRPHDLKASSGITMHLEGRAPDLPLAVASPDAPHALPSIAERPPATGLGSGDRPTVDPDPAPVEAISLSQIGPAGEHWADPATAMNFRYAPPTGSIELGSPTYETGRDADETRRRVRLTHGFWIGETEVTQGQWREVMGSSPAYFTACGDDCPVERVSWHDAVAFANRLSEASGLPACYDLVDCSGTPGGGCLVGGDYCEGAYSCRAVRSRGPACRGYRLPTEAEWEYAARAGSTTPFWTGGDLAPHQANFDGNFLYDGTPGGEYRKKTVQVGSFDANPWGLHDTHGNLWEWTEDSIEWDLRVGDARSVTGRVIDLENWNGNARAIRGGSWISSAAACRSANRDRRAPNYRSSNLGFRLVRSAE